jgi:hypothetical protein
VGLIDGHIVTNHPEIFNRNILVIPWKLAAFRIQKAVPFTIN